MDGLGVGFLSGQTPLIGLPPRVFLNFLDQWLEELLEYDVEDGPGPLVDIGQGTPRLYGESA